MLLPPLATAANAAVTVIRPITALAGRFPLITKVVMMTAIALVALKVGALGGMYAATMLSDGWTIARGILHNLRLSVMLTNVALARQKAVSLATATAHKIMAAGSKLAAAGAWLLNAALSNNPIAWVIRGVALLVGGLVWLYRTCEPVRAAFDAVFGFIGEKLAWVAEKFGWVAEKIRAVKDWFAGDDEDEALPAAPAGQRANVAPPPMPAPPQPWNPDEAMSPEAAGMAFPSGPGGMDASGMAALAGAGGGPMSFQLNVSLNGMTDADFGRRVMDGLKRRQGELEKLIAGIVDEQRRLAYG